MADFWPPGDARFPQSCRARSSPSRRRGRLGGQRRRSSRIRGSSPISVSASASQPPDCASCWRITAGSTSAPGRHRRLTSPASNARCTRSSASATSRAAPAGTAGPSASASALARSRRGRRRRRGFPWPARRPNRRRPGREEDDEAAARDHAAELAQPREAFVGPRAGLRPTPAAVHGRTAAQRTGRAVTVSA